MSELSNVKTYGGIGALLLLIGTFVPWAGPVISIVGLVLLIMAVKTVSELTKDESIFNNYLRHFIISIIAIVAVFIIVFIGFGAAGGFGWITELQTAQITDFETFWTYFGEIVGAAILALFVGWILAIIGAIYLRKSYNSIAEHTNVGLFKTTGTLYFFGAILMIVLIGFLIMFIGRIVEIIAYFSLPDKLPKEAKKEQEESKRKCPNCDRVIPEDAVTCPYCSKKF